jgi:hypothetical protein
MNEEHGRGDEDVCYLTAKATTVLGQTQLQLSSFCKPWFQDDLLDQWMDLTEP